MLDLSLVRPFTSWLLAPLGWACLALAMGLNAISPQRRLSPAESALAKQVFPGLAVEKVRMGLPGRLLRFIHRCNGGRPFVCMHVIYPGATPMSQRTFVHEMTHVWQSTWMGHAYMTQALAAQWRAAWQSWWQTGCFDDSAAYALDDAALCQQAGCWHAFNPEQQAEIVASYAEYLINGPDRSSEPLSSTIALDRLMPFMARLRGEGG
jgi:hypothetical protein